MKYLKKTDMKCYFEETLLCSTERADIKPPSHCRNGEFGFCHSKLLKGDVFIHKYSDDRKCADKKFDWIYPCFSYLISDVALCICSTI